MTMSDANKRVVVVGAGLGGMSAAISLAADGRQVTVFEKNDHVGGKLNLLEKDGFSFDLGPSILTLPQYFEKLFAAHGKQMADYVNVRRLRPDWRNVFEDGTRIDLFPDPAETVRENDAVREEDAADLERFVAHSRRLYERMEPGYFDRGLDTTWQMVRFYGPVSALFRFDLFSSIHDGVCRYVNNEYLQRILDFFIKYVGSSAYDAPAVLNLLPHVQSAFGLWYVDGGLYNLALGLRRLMEDAGVAIHLNKEVTGIRTDGGRTAGVRLADGTEHEADVVISNMEVIPAHRALLGETDRELARFRRFEPACSGLVLHLGVDREYPHLAHHNFFFSRDPKEHFRSVFRKKRLPEDPTIYLVAPARTDSTQAPPGSENIKILPHIPYVQDPPICPADYQALKERVLNKLERMGLEGLRRHVVVEHMWVPEDIERLYYSNRGAIYGVVADRWKNFGFKAPKASDRFDNLWFVGGSVNPGGGMPTALLSGQQAADMILESVKG
jgi:diapolycopene oxygenase